MSNSKKITNPNIKRETTQLAEERENISGKNIIEKSEMCKVTYVDDLIYINFKGFGLIARNEKGFSTPEIEVFYFGEIGEPDFKFRI